MGKITVGIVAMLLICTTCYCLAIWEPLKLTLKSDKGAYRVGDEIEFILNFQNTSKIDVCTYINTHYPAHSFNITNEAGTKQLAETLIKYDTVWAKENYKLIKAGENFKWIVKARVLKDKGLYLDFKDSSIRLVGPGEFRAAFRYKGRDGLTTDEEGRQIHISEKFKLQNAFIGDLISNTISIKIID